MASAATRKASQRAAERAAARVKGRKEESEQTASEEEVDPFLIAARDLDTAKSPEQKAEVLRSLFETMEAKKEAAAPRERLPGTVEPLMLGDEALKDQPQGVSRLNPPGGPELDVVFGKPEVTPPAPTGEAQVLPTPTMANAAAQAVGPVPGDPAGAVRRVQEFRNALDAMTQAEADSPGTLDPRLFQQ